MNKRLSFLCGAVLVCLLGMGETFVDQLTAKGLWANEFVVVANGVNDPLIAIYPYGQVFAPRGLDGPTFTFKAFENKLVLYYSAPGVLAGEGSVLSMWKVPDVE